ncbi:MAG TPA: formate/nitrite transporter family protein [Acidocella sp.]|jgi:formate/nitrite transporter|nr:formate/nitrite transporter family protein [Acidocella sp.]
MLEMTVDYVSPQELANAMLESGAKKAKLSVSDMMVRGVLSGAFLGMAATLSDASTVATGDALVGAIMFSFGFVIIALLNLELFTGCCAMLPFAAFGGRASTGQVLRNWIFVWIANLIGSLIYGALYAAATTKFFTAAPDPVGAKVVAVGVAKVVPYMHAGIAGWWTALVKGVLCNWLVALASVFAMISRSTIGKIVAAWLPITAFVALGFEHSVANMFDIGGAMMLGAPITVGQWMIWNEIPVTIGNIIGGMIFTALALYVTFKPDTSKAAAPAGVAVAAE